MSSHNNSANVAKNDVDENWVDVDVALQSDAKLSIAFYVSSTQRSVSSHTHPSDDEKIRE